MLCVEFIGIFQEMEEYRWAKRYTKIRAELEPKTLNAVCFYFWYKMWALSSETIKRPLSKVPMAYLVFLQMKIIYQEDLEV